MIARRTAILRVLREIVVHRAGERKRVLERLLQYAAQQDRALRTPAIGLITNKLFTLPRYHSEIRSHAENLLRTLQEIPEPPPAPTGRIYTTLIIYMLMIFIKFSAREIRRQSFGGESRR